MNVGSNHWTILAWLKDPQGNLVWYFDSLGNPIHEDFKTLFIGGANEHGIQHFGRVQFDGYQCGFWICWWVATLLDWLSSGQFLNFSLDHLVIGQRRM